VSIDFNVVSMQNISGQWFDRIVLNCNTGTMGSIQNSPQRCGSLEPTGILEALRSTSGGVAVEDA